MRNVWAEGKTYRQVRCLHWHRRSREFSGDHERRLRGVCVCEGVWAGLCSRDPNACSHHHYTLGQGWRRDVRAFLYLFPYLLYLGHQELSLSLSLSFSLSLCLSVSLALSFQLFVPSEAWKGGWNMVSFDQPLSWSVWHRADMRMCQDRSAEGIWPYSCLLLLPASKPQGPTPPPSTPYIHNSNQ